MYRYACTSQHRDTDRAKELKQNSDRSECHVPRKSFKVPFGRASQRFAGSDLGLTCSFRGAAGPSGQLRQDRRCTYHTAARSCNHRCGSKAITIACSECASVALGIQHEMACAILSSVACPALQYPYSRLNHSLLYGYHSKPVILNSNTHRNKNI